MCRYFFLCFHLFLVQLFVWFWQTVFHKLCCQFRALSESIHFESQMTLTTRLSSARSALQIFHNITTANFNLQSHFLLLLVLPLNYSFPHWLSHTPRSVEDPLPLPLPRQPVKFWRSGWLSLFTFYFTVFSPVSNAGTFPGNQGLWAGTQCDSTEGTRI